MKSFEQQPFEKKPSVDSAADADTERKRRFKLSAQMQMALAERYFGFISDNAMMIWVDADNPNGRAKAFRDIIAANPSFIDRFANESEREKTLLEIEEKLYAFETSQTKHHPRES